MTSGYRENSSSIPHAPAPWSLNGTGWIFLTHTPFSKEPIPLPEGSYAPFERGSPVFDKSSSFHGGTGCVMIVRYNSSPVGAYDELIYIPGRFAFKRPGPAGDSQPREPEYHLSITRIYVSSAASVKNGRSNWGIPKHLAKFSFSPDPNSSSSTRVTVAHPSSSSSPFFQAVLRNSRLTPVAFPVSTSWADSRLSKWLSGDFVPMLIQPPLPDPTSVESPSAKATAEGEELSWLVASSDTYVVKPLSKGKARLCNIENHPQCEWTGFGDGKSFPSVSPAIGGKGVYLPSFDMEFLVPEVFK